jgi:hypothetical protein
MTDGPFDDRNRALLYKTDPRPRIGVRVQATRDHAAIRAWAGRHHAEPATGEASASGARTLDINDDETGLRFNFPGFGRLRPISWDEWFDHFERHGLMFVYEEADYSQIAERAHTRWQARGGEGGHDRDDWFEAERDLRRAARGEAPDVRYRIVKRDSCEGAQA